MYCWLLLYETHIIDYHDSDKKLAAFSIIRIIHTFEALAPELWQFLTHAKERFATNLQVGSTWSGDAILCAASNVKLERHLRSNDGLQDSVNRQLR